MRTCYLYVGYVEYFFILMEPSFERKEILEMVFKLKKIFLFVVSGLFVVSSFFSTVYAAPELSTEELHQVLDESMEKSNQQVKDKERSSENGVPFDTKHTIFVFGDKKLKDVKSEEELKQLIQQADDGTITTKNSGWLSAQTLLNGMNKEFWISEVDGRLQTKSGSYADKPQDFEYHKISELLGEEYSSDIKGILVFNVDYDTPFGGITVAKVFPNGDVKIGLLYDVEKQTVQANKGWYSLKEIQEMIQKYHENDQKTFVGQMSGAAENFLYPAIGLGVCVIGVIVFFLKKRKV